MKDNIIIEELFTDLQGLEQLKTGARAGISVRTDSSMFAVPVRLKIVAEGDPLSHDAKVLNDLKFAAHCALGWLEAADQDMEVKKQTVKIRELLRMAIKSAGGMKLPGGALPSK